MRSIKLSNMCNDNIVFNEMAKCYCDHMARYYKNRGLVEDGKQISIYSTSKFSLRLSFRKYVKNFSRSKEYSPLSRLKGSRFPCSISEYDSITVYKNGIFCKNKNGYGNNTFNAIHAYYGEYVDYSSNANIIITGSRKNGG